MTGCWKFRHENDHITVCKIRLPCRVPSKSCNRVGWWLFQPTQSTVWVRWPLTAGAVESIYTAKDRPVEKAIPVLIGDVDDLAKVCLEIPEIALKLAARFWPGPLTLVVPKHPELPEAVSAGPTVGVRIPDHPVARRPYCAWPDRWRSLLPIFPGSQAPSAQEVFAQLGGRIALILDGGKTPEGVPSTVVDCTGGEPQILRAGPIPEG